MNALRKAYRTITLLLDFAVLAAGVCFLAFLVVGAAGLLYLIAGGA
jgi:hypothetical protein